MFGLNYMFFYKLAFENMVEPCFLKNKFVFQD
jgi:hypothetical protein